MNGTNGNAKVEGQHSQSNLNEGQSPTERQGSGAKGDRNLPTLRFVGIVSGIAFVVWTALAIWGSFGDEDAKTEALDEVSQAVQQINEFYTGRIKELEANNAMLSRAHTLIINWAGAKDSVREVNRNIYNEFRDSIRLEILTSRLARLRAIDSVLDNRWPDPEPVEEPGVDTAG